MLGCAHSSTYVASKHGMIGYTKTIAAEWGNVEPINRYESLAFHKLTEVAHACTLADSPALSVLADTFPWSAFFTMKQNFPQLVDMCAA